MRYTIYTILLCAFPLLQLEKVYILDACVFFQVEVIKGSYLLQKANICAKIVSNFKLLTNKSVNNQWSHQNFHAP